MKKSLGRHVMNVKSVKAKGRKLQNFVRDILRELYPQLDMDDIKSQTMGMTGEDIVLSPAARKLIPYSFECKNVERLQMWDAIDQCETNAGERTPVVVFKKNKRAPYVAIPLVAFCNMLENRGKKDDEKDNQEG